MNRAKVIYLPDENGNQLALDTIFSIARKASNGDQLSVQLLQLIRLGIRDIELRGIIEWDQFREHQLIVANEKGYSLTANLIKKIGLNKPLYEFSVNHNHFPTDQREHGYSFRMILFSYNKDYTQYLFCTDAIIQKEPTDTVFEKMVSEARKSYHHFMRDPSKYV
ncbi:hypothetical protein IC620_12000 [Hazenella sp. IB182357]|uniref:Uncharacterized protein n=1 Tax=Polycladospora coralii TaxID=2771432 RepID=A0A926N747_9BACL|nr:hypothetical protein [Polycladospora coralii]MBD1373076.1 hypothetical protein [Polycladospora coralii]MBS7529578.1 hypothetical protein [Polycladospora coralii]